MIIFCLDFSVHYSNIIYQIKSAKSQVASYTNSTLVMLYWHIGSLINQEILNNNGLNMESKYYLKWLKG